MGEQPPNLRLATMAVELRRARAATIAMVAALLSSRACGMPVFTGEQLLTSFTSQGHSLMEAGAHGVYDNTDLQVKPSSEDESEWVDETSAEGPTKPEEYTEAQPRPAVDIVNVQLDPTATEGSTEAVTTSMPSEAAPTIATDPPIDPQSDATQGPVMPDVLIGCDGGNF